MNTLRNIIIAGIFLCGGISTSFAASSLSLDPKTGEVIYKQSFKLNSTFKEEDAYALIQQWFTQSPDKFTRQNIEITAKVSSKNKAAVDEAFNNSQPLQSLDPDSKRLAAKVVVKYYGSGFNATINLLYIEYYVVMEVKGHELTATVNRIAYHHFNRHTYAPQMIYSWQGGRPLDSVDKFSKLMEGQESNHELGNVSTFLNNDMAKLFTDLRQLLQNNKALANSRG